MSFKQLIPVIEEEWDAYWQRTSVEEELHRAMTDGLRPIFEKFLPKTGRILESGCGLGKWIIRLSEAGYDITGVDTNRYALEKLKKYYPDAKVSIADVRQLPFADESFDTYLSLGVIEHFESGPSAALREAYRVLKKGGVAFIEVPYDSPLRRLSRLVTGIILVSKIPARMLLEFIGIREPRKPRTMRFYEYRYTTDELEQFVRRAGFTLLRTFPKDDLSPERSIALWLDYLSLRKAQEKLFEINMAGKIVKKILEAISPYSYSALIVAVARKEESEGSQR